MERLGPLFETIRPYLPYVLAVLPFVAGILALAVQGRLREFTRETVAAVYRAAIHAANELQDEGLTWLRGPEGIAYRKTLAERAYDLIPLKLGPVPVGLLKTVVSREMFCSWIEVTFNEVVKLADCLELDETNDAWLDKLLSEEPAEK